MTLERTTLRGKVGATINTAIDFVNNLYSLVTNLTAAVIEGTPVNAVNATATLTISGVVVDGQTVTFGADVYEFAADEAQTVTEGHIAVDITDYATKAQGTLTIDTQPTANDTITIGASTYTFVLAGTADAAGEINIGTNLEGTQANIVAAINGTDSFNTPNASVTAGAFSSDDSILTALIGGTAGNAIVSTSSLTAVTNVFDAVVLGTTTAGTACSAANAVTALVAAAEQGTELFDFADGVGNTVVATAQTAGVLYNGVATTETMSNGAWGGLVTAGGVNGTVGLENDLKRDANYMYILVADNTVSGKNWKNVELDRSPRETSADFEFTGSAGIILADETDGQRYRLTLKDNTILYTPIE